MTASVRMCALETVRNRDVAAESPWKGSRRFPERISGRTRLTDAFKARSRRTCVTRLCSSAPNASALQRYWLLSLRT